MKRKLLILSGLFLGLWVGCLFFPGRTSGIHIALLVELVFLLQYVFTIKSAAITAVPEVEVIVMNQPENEIESDKKTGTEIPDIPLIYQPANMQEEEVFS